MQKVIREIMKEQGVTQKQLAERAGYKYQADIEQILRGENMRVETLVRVSEGLGYKVVLKGKDKDYVVGEGWSVHPDVLTEYDYGKKRW